MVKHAMIVAAALMACGCSEKTTVQQPAAAPAVSVTPAASAPASAPAPVLAPAPAPLTLTAESIGAVKFGSKLSEVEAALNEKASGPQTDECSYVQFKKIPDVLFMVEQGVVTRADLRGDVPNITGFRVGGDPAALRSKYPAAEVTGHSYVPAGHNIKIAGQGKAALLFEDDGKQITSVRAGIEPSVSYSEGCS